MGTQTNMSNHVRLEVNAEKTNLQFMSRRQKTRKNHCIAVANKSCGKVKIFCKYGNK